MKVKNILRTVILASAAILMLQACETYPDWEESVEYSNTFPISGEYYVVDFDDETGDTLRDASTSTAFQPYSLYIYNTANTEGDSLWIDNKTGHPTGGLIEYPFKYKIKSKANLSGLSFDCEKSGNIAGLAVTPVPNAIRITITESKVFDYDPGNITSSKADSIYFKFTYYDGDGNLIKTVTTTGHRKTGWEEPEDDDEM